MTRVDIRWSPARIKAFCETHDDWLLVLSDDMSPRSLKALFKRHIASPVRYDGVIAEIAAHPCTPIETLRDIRSAFARNIEVLASLATNPSLSDDLRANLSRNRHPTVRRHAKRRRLRLS